MKYLERIKKYVKKHSGAIAFSTALGIGALGMYLTNTPDVFAHWKDYMGAGYQLDGLIVYIPPKDPQPVRALVAYISGILTVLSPLIGKLFSSDKE